MIERQLAPRRREPLLVAGRPLAASAAHAPAAKRWLLSRLRSARSLRRRLGIARLVDTFRDAPEHNAGRRFGALAGQPSVGRRTRAGGTTPETCLAAWAARVGRTG